MLDHWGKIRIPTTVTRGPVYVSTVIFYSLTYNAADVMDNDNLATSLSVQILSIVLIGTVRKGSIKPIVLAKRWVITPEKLQNPIQATMQRGIMNMLHSSLLRWFRTNDRNSVFSDTMFFSTLSRRGNRCGQVYDTDFWWARAYPMASISEAHKTLSLLFAWNEVLPACICNNTKEITQDKFYQRLKDAECHLKQL